MRINNMFIRVLVFSLVLASLALNAQNDNNFEVSKNLDIFTTLYKEINTNYVDEVSPGELMETGIEAMLKELDPYTIYIPESRVEDYKLITTGQYGGIGSLIHTNGDYVVISEPYEDYPAAKSGLKAGDKILEIKGESAKGKKSDEVSEILKGQPGTEVTLKIERPGTDDPLTFNIVREKITIDNIPYYGILDGDIGYIKLTGFTKNAGQDVRKAFLDLKKEHELQGLILDLRGNGGGLLQEAVNISNIFVDKGKTIVSTKGKLLQKNQEHKTRFTPVDKDIPLVVMVNRTSASASEIVAGALQDFDRGVIIGQKTFGKGLVQNVIPLSYNAQAKITVAKYYIPSGRCIQAIDYSHKDDNGDYNKIPDSLMNKFKTANGRLVYDGGGIIPDIKLEPEKFSDITTSLYSKFIIFDYATKFANEHPQIDDPESFEITEEIFEDFRDYIADKDYDYTTQSEEILKKLKKAAEKDKYLDAIEDHYYDLEKALMHNKEEDVITYQDQIKELLKIEITGRYYHQKGKIKASLSDDPEIKQAIRLLNEQEKYEAILDGTYQAPDIAKDEG